VASVLKRISRQGRRPAAGARVLIITTLCLFINTSRGSTLNYDAVTPLLLPSLSLSLSLSLGSAAAAFLFKQANFVVFDVAACLLGSEGF